METTISAPPETQIDELVSADRTKHMPRGGDEIRESTGNDQVMDSGDITRLQLAGLLEDLEVDVQSPTILDPQFEISQERLGAGFVTDDNATAIKIGMLGMVGSENGNDGCTAEGKPKSAQLEVKPVQDSELSIAEEAAVDPNLFSRLPAVKNPVLPGQFSSEATVPSSMPPTDCLQQMQIHDEPGQEQSPVMPKFLRSPGDGGPEENTDANQPSSSTTENAVLYCNAICTDCTIPPETLIHENSTSNTSIVEGCHQNLMSAGRVTECVDLLDGDIASTDVVPAGELQGESVKLCFLPASDTLINKESLRKYLQPGSELGLDSRSKGTLQSSHAAEASAINIEIMPKIVPTSGVQCFNQAPGASSYVSQPITLEFQDAMASVMPHVRSCASPVSTPTRADLTLEDMMLATQNPDFVEANSMKERRACPQEPQDSVASEIQVIPSEHQTSLPFVPLADHLQHEDSGNGTVRCAIGPSLYEFASAPQSLEIQMQMETDKQLQHVQNSAKDAMVAATSVLEQSQSVWARIQTQYPSESGAVWDAQIASVAATIAAAASITKAAVEAARAIAQASNEAFNQLGLRLEEGAQGEAVPHLAFCNSNGKGEDGNAQMESRIMMTAAATSDGEMKKRAIAAARDAMVRAAKATSQAGDVITTGIHLLQAKAVEDAWNTKIRDKDAHSSKQERVDCAKRKGKEERKLTAHAPTRSVAMELSPANRKRKRKERKASIEKPTTNKLNPSNEKLKESKLSAEKPRRITAVEHSPANRKRKEESKMSAGKPKKRMSVEHSPGHRKLKDKILVNAEKSRRIITEDLSPANRRHKEESIVSAKKPARRMTLEVSPAKRKHGDSQLGAEKHAISMAVELSGANLKGKREKSKLSEGRTTISMAKELIPVNTKGKKEKRKASAKKPVNMAIELWHANTKGKKEKRKVSAEKPSVSMAMERSPANRESKEEKRKGSGEKPIRSVAVEPSPSSRKRKADSKATAENPAKRMAIEVNPANAYCEVEGNVSAVKPTKHMATEHSSVNMKHKVKGKVSAKKPAESVVAELSTANRGPKAESKVAVEKALKALVVEHSPVKVKGKEKVSADEPPHSAIVVQHHKEQSQARATRRMAIEPVCSAIEVQQHKEKSQARATRSTVIEPIYSAIEVQQHKEKSQSRATRSTAIEPPYSAVEVQKHKKKNQARTKRSMAIELSPDCRKHEENQVRATRSTTTELATADRKDMEESPISLKKSTRSTVVDLSPANRKHKREDSKVNTENPTRSMEVKLSPAKMNSKKERRLSEGTKSKAEGLSSINMKDKDVSPANMNKTKMESKVSQETLTSSMGVELRPAKIKGKKENEVIGETPTTILVAELSPANMKHKKNGSKVSEEMPTRNVAVELSSAVVKAKNKKRKVSEAILTSKAVELSLSNCKGKKDGKANTEKPMKRAEVDHSLTPDRSTSRITRQSLQQAKTNQDGVVNENAGTSMEFLVLKSGPSSARMSTRNGTNKDVRILEKGEGRTLDGLVLKTRSVGKSPSKISDPPIMPMKSPLSVRSSSLKAKTLKKDEVVRMDTLMTRMQHRAELNQPEQSLKLPSKRNSSKGHEKSSAKTVSTRSEARQLRSKTSKLKIDDV